MFPVRTPTDTWRSKKLLSLGSLERSRGVHFGSWGYRRTVRRELGGAGECLLPHVGLELRICGMFITPISHDYKLDASLLAPSLLSLLGPIICLLPLNWLRIVAFGNGAVDGDSGGAQRKDSIRSSGYKWTT